MLEIKKEVVTKFYDSDGKEIFPGDKVRFSKANTNYVIVAIFDGIDSHGAAQFYSPDELISNFNRKFRRFGVLPKSIEAIYRVAGNE